MVVMRVIDALGDIIRLLVIRYQYRTAFIVDTEFGIVIADTLDGIARNLDLIDVSVGGDLTSQYH
jgi:hypothetical protein